jgi:hypothetical protein
LSFVGRALIGASFFFALLNWVGSAGAFDLSFSGSAALGLLVTVVYSESR